MMISFVKTIYRVLSQQKRKLTWYFQFNLLRKRLSLSSKVNYENMLYNKMLILIPHADDELIGCYQLISKYKDNIKLFYCGFTGSNFNIENKNARLLEFKSFCEDIGVEYKISSDDIEIDLQREISDYSPEAVLLPSCIDWHSEHRKINYILEEVLLTISKSPSIVWYQISVPIMHKYGGFYVPLAKQSQKEKWFDFYRFYKTQKHMPIERYKFIERISGFRNGCFAAEEFAMLKAEIWRSHLRVTKRQEVEKQLNNLSSKINDIEMIYKEVDNIYQSYYK